MTDEKQQTVLDAAQSQFLRYGFRRVTMADIAGAAGISRPALYLVFANKEAIFNGVYARYVDSSLSEIEKGIDDFSSISEKLSFAVEVWTIRPYKLLHGTPEGRELADCSYDFAADLVGNSYQRFEAVIESVLTPYPSGAKRNTMTPANVAQVFALALRGMKSGAKDVSHLRILVENLINITTSSFDDAAERASNLKPAPRKRSKQ